MQIYFSLQEKTPVQITRLAKIHSDQWKFVMGQWNLNTIIEKQELETQIPASG